MVFYKFFLFRFKLLLIKFFKRWFCRSSKKEVVIKEEMKGCDKEVDRFYYILV